LEEPALNPLNRLARLEGLQLIFDRSNSRQEVIERNVLIGNFVHGLTKEDVAAEGRKPNDDAPGFGLWNKPPHRRLESGDSASPKQLKPTVPPHRQPSTKLKADHRREAWQNPVTTSDRPERRSLQRWLRMDRYFSNVWCKSWMDND
jgi:hypothetical protein